MASNPCKLLVSYTKPDEFDAAESELRKNSFSFILKKVFSIQEFAIELDAFNPEIIVICSNSSSLNENQIIDLSEKKTPAVPVIIIADINSSSFIESSQLSKVSDYFISNALKRFPFAVKKAYEYYIENQATNKADSKEQKSDARYKALIEQMHEGLLVVDNNDTILFANKKFYEMLGYTAEELVGKIGYKVIIPGEEQSIIIENNKKRLAGISEEYEIRMVKKSGEFISVLMNASPVKDNSGLVIGSMATCLDITRKKKIEDALKESEEKFRKAFITSPDSININRMDDGAFISINKGFTQITGFTEEDVIGKSSLQVNIWANSTDRKKLLDELKNNRIAENLEFTFKRKSGELITGLMSAAIINLNGAPCILSITRDITEKKKIENALRESEKIFSAFMEHSPVFVFFKDKDTRSLRLSKNYEKMLGRPLNELLNKTMDELFPSDLAKKMIADDMQIMREGLRTDIEEEFNGKHYNTIKFPILQSGEPDFLAGFTIDITDRKIAESSLRESERRLSTLMANLPGISYRCKNDKNWTMEFVSEGCKELTGYDSSDLINNSKISFNQIIHPDFRQHLWERWQDVLAKKEKLQEEYQITTANGELKWVWEQGQGVFDSNGNLIALEGFITDITVRKKTEKLLTEIHQLNKDIILSIPSGLFIYQYTPPDKLVLLEGNPAAVKSTGIDLKAAIGKDFCEIWQGENNQEILTNYLSAIKTGKDYITEDLHYIDEIIDAAFAIRAFQLPENRLGVAFENISERKKAEEQLISARKKAEESDKLKSAFLANMSHEIRTPMNGIVGFAELMRDPSISEQQRKMYIDIVNRSSAQLLNIINDIIDISKIEAGQEVVKPEIFNLNALLDEIFIFFETMAKQKNIELVLQKSLTDTDALINSDPVKLKQILNNLIGNAIKFTEKGHIKICSEAKADKLIFEISDTGLGIPTELHSAVFERFMQVEMSYTRKYGGTGLGLSISKSYVEMLGGSISLKSEINKGSTFTIILPYNKESQIITKSTVQKTGSISHLNLKGKTLLIAEDEEINIRFLQAALKNSGAEILFAYNGNKAVEIARENKQISLILMDLKMPELTGIEATYAIKEFNPDVPIVALTAYAFTDDKEKSIKAGCCDFLVKPVPLNNLYLCIQKHIK